MQNTKVFTDEMEKDLAEHCINLVEQHHGLSMDKVKMLAYKFAEKKQVSIPKNWSDYRRAGREWMRSFIKRHNLSLRSSELTILGRAASFNRATVDVFFEKYL